MAKGKKNKIPHEIPRPMSSRDMMEAIKRKGENERNKQNKMEINNQDIIDRHCCYMGRI